MSGLSRIPARWLLFDTKGVRWEALVNAIRIGIESAKPKPVPAPLGQAPDLRTRQPVARSVAPSDSVERLDHHLHGENGEFCKTVRSRAEPIDDPVKWLDAKTETDR